MAYDSLMVFTGNANPALAADVVKRLNISLGRAHVGRFSDGEISVESLTTLQTFFRGMGELSYDTDIDPSTMIDSTAVDAGLVILDGSN